MPEARVTAEVNITPRGGKGQSATFRDIRSAETNISVSGEDAGNFNVTLALPHGMGIASHIGDNDLVDLSIFRGEEGGNVFRGQIDRISRTSRPEYVEWTIRGKNLSKQLVTNVAYLSYYGAIPGTGKGVDSVDGITGLRPQQMNIFQVARYILGIKTLTRLTTPNGQEVVGLSVGEFVEKLILESPWVDASMFAGVEIIADHLIVFGGDGIAFRTIADVIGSLADPPYIYWFVDEDGVFHFKPWIWRDGTPQIIIPNEKFLNEHTSISDYSVIAGCSVQSSFAGTVNPEVGFAIAYNDVIGSKYGTRFSVIQDAPYLYNREMVLRRANDHLQLNYLKRIESTVAVRGEAYYRIDRNVYVDKLKGYFYLDSVQHRLQYEDQDLDWTTTLGLTHGRVSSDSFIDIETANATISTDIIVGRVGLPRDVSAYAIDKEDQDA